MPIAQKKRIGNGLRVLLINDNPSVEITFMAAFALKGIGAELVFRKTVEEGTSLIRKSVLEGKSFNAIFLDKNMGGSAQTTAQALIKLVEAESPKSHICIESAESGPGKFGKFPFISLIGDISEANNKIREFMEKVAREPYRKTPSKISLRSIRRPHPVLCKDGVVKVFHWPEDGKMPNAMTQELKKGGKTLTIQQAIEHGYNERISNSADVSALFAERKRVAGIVTEAKKRSKFMNRFFGRNRQPALPTPKNRNHRVR